VREKNTVPAEKQAEKTDYKPNEQTQKIHLDLYRQTVQLVIFLPTFNAPCMSPQIQCDGW
jgi:hypothetical protein